MEKMIRSTVGESLHFCTLQQKASSSGYQATLEIKNMISEILFIGFYIPFQNVL